MARRARAAATLLVLLVLLAAAAYYGWLGLTEGWGDEDGGQAVAPSAEPTPSQTCTTPPPRLVRARQIRVSVYNAGAPGGQAGETLDALAEQGFREGELADAPDDIEVDGYVLWPGDADPAAVRLVRRQFEDARVAGHQRTLGPGVNVLVGQEFGGLADHAPRRIRVPRPEECRTVQPGAEASE